jgi:hypothetical protein
MCADSLAHYGLKLAESTTNRLAAPLGIRNHFWGS